LAGPSIMGLSGGASLAVLVALIAVPSLTYNGSIVASFIGALLGYGAVPGIALCSPNGFSPARLALAGTIVSSLLGAVTHALVIYYRLAGDMLYWTVGGISTASWGQVAAIAPVCLIGLVGALAIAPSVTMLSLG